MIHVRRLADPTEDTSSAKPFQTSMHWTRLSAASRFQHGWMGRLLKRYTKALQPSRCPAQCRPHWHVSYIQLGVVRVCRLLHSNADAADGLQAVGDLADIDAKTAKLLATLLQPFLSVGILLMVVRIVLSWYPQVRSPSPVQVQAAIFAEG